MSNETKPIKVQKGIGIEEFELIFLLIVALVILTVSYVGVIIKSALV